MDLEESRFRATWKRFLEVLKVDHNCSLADVCRKQHTTLGDMSSWMSRRGYSVKQARKDVVRDYYNGVAHSRTTTSSPSFTQIVPVMLSEEEFSLSGITITLKNLLPPPVCSNNSCFHLCNREHTPAGIENVIPELFPSNPSSAHYLLITSKLL